MKTTFYVRLNVEFPEIDDEDESRLVQPRSAPSHDDVREAVAKALEHSTASEAISTALCADASFSLLPLRADAGDLREKLEEVLRMVRAAEDDDFQARRNFPAIDRLLMEILG